MENLGYGVEGFATSTVGIGQVCQNIIQNKIDENLWKLLCEIVENQYNIY